MAGDDEVTKQPSGNVRRYKAKTQRNVWGSFDLDDIPQIPNWPSVELRYTRLPGLDLADVGFLGSYI